MPKRRLFGNQQSDARQQVPRSSNKEQKSDLGFGTSISAKNRRLINQDGTFNVRRVGQRIEDIHPFQFLVTIPWWQFGLLVMTAYILFNILFALLYMIPGVEHLSGGESLTGWWPKFTYAFFFSVQTFTTVGYGTVSPVGPWVNTIAALEAMAGLLGFALATGIMWGRFSQPSAKIGFSETALISPYKDSQHGEINSFQFRIVNKRINQLVELEAQLVLMYYVMEDGKEKQEFKFLSLERSQVAVFPLSWTLVHPITKDSPLYACNPEELKAKHAEFLIILKGYDETFAQTVRARMSYRHDEITWGAKFVRIFQEMEDGPIELQVHKVSKCERAELNEY